MLYRKKGKDCGGMLSLLLFWESRASSLRGEWDAVPRHRDREGRRLEIPVFFNAMCMDGSFEWSSTLD